jgi:folate-binding protein YgfZ
MQAAMMPGRGVVRVSGPEARDFLHGLVSNDILSLRPERAGYAALLSPQGKVLFDFLVVPDEDSFLLDCERARAGDLVKRLTLYKLRAKVAVADVSAEWRIAALWGDSIAARLGLPNRPGAARRHEGGIALVDPRLAALGARLILPVGIMEKTVAALGLTPATFDDYIDHRFALGVGEGAAELGSEALFLLETNAEPLHAVDFRKGCYVGQELTARMKHRATLRKRLMPAWVEGPAPAPDSTILADGKAVGTIRAVHGNRALALIRLEPWTAARTAGTTLTADGATLSIETPDWLDAAIAADDAAVEAQAAR